MKKGKMPKAKTEAEIIASIRGSWHGVNPVTRIVQGKTKYTRKEKHKSKAYESADSCVFL